MFRWFEQLIDPFRPTENLRPPDRLGPFFWFFVRQCWPVLAALMAAGFASALIEVALFDFLGRLVDILGDSRPARLLDDYGTELLMMALVVLVVRPIVAAAHLLLVHQAVEPNLTNLVRWQTHRYVLRQSMNFFQNDFAGRIANRIIQTGPSLRECVVSAIDAIWFVSIYAVSALVLFAGSDLRLTVPLVLWIAVYVAALGYFVPRIQRRSKVMSEARSGLTGRIVDSYTNMTTVKLFAHTEREDDYVREAMRDHTEKFYDLLRYITQMNIAVWTANGFLIGGTAMVALWLWQAGAITTGALALAVGLVIRISNMSGWIMWVVTSIFENFGTVQESMETISKPYEVIDRPGAGSLAVPRGAIRYDAVRFHYGKERTVIDGLSLDIAAGERVGLIGRSGAGKSTLVNLLLRFYDLEGGRILIDGQDIAGISQDSLRAQIGVVSQDTSLLHRSVLDNIVYGRLDAGREQAVAAAKRAHAHEFIMELEDAHGRRGYDAHVGERGVKLSGGQRQRIAIARVLLKDAPILVLDEATSALDSEIEAAIQDQLYNLMEGKTVIAIAHRLSTIARLDRLVVLDRGRIVEQGSHDSLLARGGLYAGLWARQSGGFLIDEPAA